MKKAFLIVIVALLSACSVFTGFSEKLINTVKEKKNSVKISDLTDFEWNYLRIIHPYESRKIFGETLKVESDDICLWAFADTDSIIKKFEIPRKKVECKNLPNKTYSRGETLFLIRDGGLQERKKFEAPVRSR